MLDKICYVTKSSYRTRVLLSLKGEVKMPMELSKDCDILQNHISTVLRQLKDMGLVECINPEAKRGRLYRLTSDGEMLVEKLS